MMDTALVQTRLIAHGYEPGPVDGVFGPMTRAALSDFQRDRRITVDAIPTPETVGALSAAPKPVRFTVDLLAGLGATMLHARRHVDCMAAWLPGYGIGTPLQAAHFLGQTFHESMRLARTEEILTYTTAQRICAVWPSRFPTLESARQYVRNPKALANRVYGGRMGNRPGTDDGWKHRGFGLIHLTGRDNQAKFFRWAGLPEETKPHLIGTIYAVPSAVYFWVQNNCHEFADHDDIEALTRRINGGTHGLADRRILTSRAKALIRAQAREA
jgi:predicted chitinase